MGVATEDINGRKSQINKKNRYLDVHAILYLENGAPNWHDTSHMLIRRCTLRLCDSLAEREAAAVAGIIKCICVREQKKWSDKREGTTGLGPQALLCSVVQCQVQSMSN